MNYYKHEDIIVAAKHRPMVIDKDAVILIEGKQVSLSKISESFDAGISVSFGSGFLKPWEEVSALEYKLYMASKFDYLEVAPQSDQTGMWAINTATEPQLRLGGEDPDGNDLGDVVSRDGKMALVAKTQHWYHPDRPRQRDTNSAWTKWIMRTRKTDPFIYLG